MSNDEWFTDSSFLDRVEKFFNGPIDLDPTSSLTSIAGQRARQIMTIEEDCLTTPWPRFINGFMNPPYSKPSLFIDRYIEQRAKVEDDWHTVNFAAQGEPVWRDVILVNCCTSTKWCQKLMNWGDYACFPSPRMRFLRPRKSKEEIHLEMGSPIEPHFDRPKSYIGLDRVTRNIWERFDKFEAALAAENKLETVESLDAVELVCPSSPRYDNLVVARGGTYEEFVEAFGDLGRCVRLN